MHQNNFQRKKAILDRQKLFNPDEEHFAITALIAKLSI
jgi:hypothetical protein